MFTTHPHFSTEWVTFFTADGYQIMIFKFFKIKLEMFALAARHFKN